MWNPNIEKKIKNIKDKEHSYFDVDKCKAEENICSICNSKEGFTIRCSCKIPTQCEK